MVICISSGFLYTSSANTTEEREYKGHSHLAKKLILRLPRTKKEKEHKDIEQER